MKSNNEQRQSKDGRHWFGKYWIGGILVSVFMIGNCVTLKNDGYFLVNGFLDSILNFPNYLKEFYPTLYIGTVIAFYVLIFEKGYYDYQEGMAIREELLFSLIDSIIILITFTILVLFVF